MSRNQESLESFADPLLNSNLFEAADAPEDVAYLSIGTRKTVTFRTLPVENLVSS